MPSNRIPTTFYGPGIPTLGDTDIYTVASGKIAVVRFVAVYNSDVADSQLKLRVNGTVGADVVLQKSILALADDLYWVYIPLVATDVLNVESDGVCVYTVTGDLYDA